MPRASWNGFLRLSLVTCPVYLVPATTEAKRVRFNQLNAETGNRVAQQLVDSKTGDPVDRDQIVKGYEYERGRYVTISDDELKDLQIESSKIIDLDRFVERDEVDPLYLDTPYYVHPDGEIAAETFRVIGEAIATMSASASPFGLAPNSGGRTSSAERTVDITSPPSRGSTSTSLSRLDKVTWPSPTLPVFSIASPMTRNVSAAISPSGWT